MIIRRYFLLRLHIVALASALTFGISGLCLADCSNNSEVLSPAVQNKPTNIEADTLLPQAEGEVAECAVSADEVVNQPDQYVLLDVRDSAKAMYYGPAGAMRMRLRDLGRSPFLARDGRSNVLIGNSEDVLRLLAICHQQSARIGVGMRVIIGGVREWYRRGGEVWGDIGLLDAPLIGGSEEIRSLSRSPSVWVLSDQVSRLAPGMQAKLIDTSKSAPEQVARRLSLLRLSGMPLAIVAIFSAPTNVEPWREALLSHAFPDPIFHAGDIDAYLAWSRQHDLVTDSAARARPLGCRWN